jgi:multidrug efflux pump subunit AcrA (membrane-fusion protein)
MSQIPMTPVCSAPDMESEHTIPTNAILVQRSRWRERKEVIGIPLFLLGIILLAALFGPLRQVAGFQKQPVTRAVTADPIITSATGFLQAPVYNLNFSTAVGGLVSSIDVRLGQQVVAGQLLAHLGYNTYLAQLRVAEVAVDAARKELQAAQAHVVNVFAHIHAEVFLAKTTLQAELNNRQALIRQAQANIRFALVTLAKDQATLQAVIIASNAAIQSAEQTKKQAIAACPPPTTGASSLSTDTTGSNGSSNTGSTTANNTGSNNSSSTNTTASSPDANGTATTAKVSDESSSVSPCVKAAKAAFIAAVTAAQQNVVTARGTVAQDLAALRQAKANANVNLVAVIGRIHEARAAIEVARTDPDRTNAFIALTAAEYTYRVALATLLVAQQTLALTNLYAPHDGVVTAVIGTIGGIAGAVDNLVPAGGLEIQSDHGGLTFIQITDTHHVDRIHAYVDETEISKVYLGQPVTFTLKAYGNHQFSGHVIRIAPNGLGYPGMPTSVKYLTVIAIDGNSIDSHALYHHMTASVNFG